jgi:O-antigen/teichoic acid export membrane protein
MNILTTCIGPLLNIVMLMLGYASVGMAISSLIICIICRIAYTAYCRKAIQIRPCYNNMPVSSLKSILSFSFWIFLATVVGTLNNATDSVMMGAVPTLATTAVAVYSVGQTFNGIVISLTTGISSLLTPRVTKLVFTGASSNDLVDFAVRIGRLQGLIFALVVSGFIAFGQPFIAIYAGEGYEDAYWVAMLMMIPNMIPLLQSVCLNVILAQNKHKFRSLVHLGVAILNVIGTWYIMHVMGIVGAALMTGITLLIGHGLAMNWYYHIKIGLDMFRFWKECAKIFIIPVIMCAITLLLCAYINFENPPIMIIGIICYTAVYCALNWFFIMNEYEKNLIAEPILRVLRASKKQP